MALVLLKCGSMIHAIRYSKAVVSSTTCLIGALGLTSTAQAQNPSCIGFAALIIAECSPGTVTSEAAPTQNATIPANSPGVALNPLRDYPISTGDGGWSNNLSFDLFDAEG